MNFQSLLSVCYMGIEIKQVQVVFEGTDSVQLDFGLLLF